MQEEKYTFSIQETPEEGAEKTISYAVEKESSSTASDGCVATQGEQKTVQEAPETAQKGTDTCESAENYPEGYDKNAPEISATAKTRGFTKEYVLIALSLAICPAGICLGLKFTGYKYVCFIIAAMGVLTAYALVRHIIICRKVNALLSAGKCSTVTGLMKELKLKKKPDFVRTLGGMVREGHLTGYKIAGEELIIKVDVDSLPEETHKSWKETLFKKKK